MTLRLGSNEFDDDELIVMAVVNRTPDSFYDKGSAYQLHDAIAQVDSAVASGAQIIDIGGVKAAPGPDISPTEEIRRLTSLVPVVRERHPTAVTSVDTWRAEVAEAAIVVGADMINDAWGGYDPDVARVAGKYGAGLVCTHAGGLTPRTVFCDIDYPDVMADIRATLTVLAEKAVSIGVSRDSVMIDPGHDFKKTTAHSLEVTRRLSELTAGPWPSSWQITSSVTSASSGAGSGLPVRSLKIPAPNVTVPTNRAAPHPDRACRGWFGSAGAVRELDVADVFGPENVGSVEFTARGTGTHARLSRWSRLRPRS